MRSLFLFICLIFFLACNSDSGSFHASDTRATAMDMAIEEESYGGNDAYYEQGQGNVSQSMERKLIKHGELRFEVENLEHSTKKIEEIAKTHNGFISNMNQSNSNYSLDNRMQIKVPTEKFESFVNTVESESVYTDYKNINSNDVTEEYTDVSIRLKTKKEVRDRYIDILKSKAKTVQDILDAEDKIRRIQEEIESMEGRLKYLNDRVDYSTIVVNIYQKVPYQARRKTHTKSFLTKVKESFVQGGELFVNLILFLINLWPLILIAFIIFLFKDRIKALFSRKS